MYRPFGFTRIRSPPPAQTMTRPYSALPARSPPALLPSLPSTSIIRCAPSPFHPAFSVSAVSTTPPRLLLEWMTVPRSVTSPVWLTSPVPTPMNASIPGFAPEMPACFHVKSRYFPLLLSLSHRAFVPAVV